MACLTGVGATLVCANTSLKFRTASNESYQIRRISGLGRSVITIDDSHLGLDKNGPMNYCPGDLVELRPLTVEVKQEPDNTDRFPSKTDGSNAMQDPIPLGIESGTTSTFTLTFPSTNTTALTLQFSGFLIDDSGIDFTMRDRLNSTYQIQPDGKKLIWTVAAS